MILKSIRDGAGVSSFVDLEAVLDAVQVKNIVKFPGVDLQTILIANINGDNAIFA